MNTPLVPVSWGELIDKLTILDIKRARLSDDAARANVVKEWALLQDVAKSVLTRADVAGIISELKAVNEALWDIEDDIREKEKAKAFDGAFVELARAVYQKNDLRAALKRKINLALGSELTEEKSYKS